MTQLKDMATEFLAHKRIAVAGVSSTKDDAANLIYRKLRDEHYEVFALNPKVGMVEGDPCYPNVGSVPGGVEAVVIVTTPEITKQVVQDCADAGVKYVWMHKGIGSSVSDEAVQLAKDKGMMVIPGACPMMYCDPVDFGHKCIRWFMGAFGSLPKV